MKRENTLWRPATAASLDWTEGGEPRSSHFGDVYYSRDNGRQESQYVFLQGNGLPQRWQNWPAGRFCIAETGFGTGLNFLLTWQAWLATPAPRPDLHYVSIEKYPLRQQELARALAAWPELAPLAKVLLRHYPGLVPGQHRLLLEQGQVTLDLWWEDIADALGDLASPGRPLVDAWYLDGFAPARNEAMWEEGVLQSVGALSRPGATFSTFTAAGQVRRQLAAAGFSVERVAGYGRKRECLRGRMAQPPLCGQLRDSDTPWDIPATTPGRPQQAIVVGAGLAGCSAAWALARRGVEVFLLEHGTLAAGGSGNNQGILYTRLSRRHSALTDFSLQSYRFSTELYGDMFASGRLRRGIDGALCGSFHQSDNADEMAALAGVLPAVPELAQVLDPLQASAIVGIQQPAAGYWFPRSGWLHPAALCRVLAAHPNIHLLENCGRITLEPMASGWRASNDSGQAWQADCAVVATGTASSDATSLDWLPLQIIRGQTTELASHTKLGELRAALCHEGYVAPARDGSHCIGASFNLEDTGPDLQAADHRDNLEKLARAVPAWREILAGLDPAGLAGRVGYRCASPDYLPMVGPVPDRQAFMQQFAGLRQNARQPIPARGSYLPGLFLSTAHGSRGLTSAPLAAELLASQACGEPPPLSRELVRALAPARFIIRDLSRNRI